jgi:hypothetical protein
MPQPDLASQRLLRDFLVNKQRFRSMGSTKLAGSSLARTMASTSASGMTGGGGLPTTAAISSKKRRQLSKTMPLPNGYHEVLHCSANLWAVEAARALFADKAL